MSLYPNDELERVKSSRRFWTAVGFLAVCVSITLDHLGYNETALYLAGVGLGLVLAS